MQRLRLHSQPPSPDGNLQGQGQKRQLGTSKLHPFTVLIREATQNSCDAVNSAEGGTIRWRIRVLKADEQQFLRTELLSELPSPDTSRAALRNFLYSDTPWVLEIADYGCCGLAGPTTADEIGEPRHFVNFLRDIGATKEELDSGGTYGFGKAAYYSASACAAILVDTMTTATDGRPERRFMAAHIGNADPGLHIGRHWWGIPNIEKETVDPVRGADAAEIARRLGLPERNDRNFGTTVCILAPRWAVELSEQGTAPAEIAEALTKRIKADLLLYFWPRMSMHQEPRKRIRCEIWDASEERFQVLPRITDIQPLKLYDEAFELARGGKEPADEKHLVKAIESENPVARIGQLAITLWDRVSIHDPILRDGYRDNLLHDTQDSDDALDQPPLLTTNGAAALMRTADMVVDYHRPGSDLGDTEGRWTYWAAVFRTSDDPRVSEQFRRAESVTHDRWDYREAQIPNKTNFVKLALRQINSMLRKWLQPPKSGPGIPEHQHPLGRPSNALGKYLSGPGQAAPARPKTGAGGGGTGRKPKAQVTACELGEHNGQIVAIFTVSIKAPRTNTGHCLLVAEPRVVLDGSSERMTEDLAAAIGSSDVVGWRTASGAFTPGDTIAVDLDQIDTLRVVVRQPAAPLTLNVHLKDAAESEGQQL